MNATCVLFIAQHHININIVKISKLVDFQIC